MLEEAEGHEQIDLMRPFSILGLSVAGTSFHNSQGNKPSVWLHIEQFLGDEGT